MGVDAKTPHRAGIRDVTTPYQRNPNTPWAQGKDTAAWSAVRAAIDPEAPGGDYFAPAGGVKGAHLSPYRRVRAPRSRVTTWHGGCGRSSRSSPVWNWESELSATAGPRKRREGGCRSIRPLLETGSVRREADEQPAGDFDGQVVDPGADGTQHGDDDQIQDRHDSGERHDLRQTHERRE